MLEAGATSVRHYSCRFHLTFSPIGAALPQRLCMRL